MEGSAKFFEKPITNKEIDEASELELADRFGVEKKRSMEKYQVEIKGELIELFERAYFDTMDKIESMEASLSDEDLKEKLGFDMNKLREYVDVVFPRMIEEISALSIKENLHIISDNSFRDVLSNSFFGGLGHIKRIREKFSKEDKRSDILSNMENPKSNERIGLKNFYNLLNSPELKYYTDEICKDEEKLKMEVELGGGGYLSKFSEYFLDIESGGIISKNYPSGSKKLPYFRFFSEVEKWKDGKDSEINDDNFEEELGNLKKIDDRSKSIIIDKDKIRRDFSNK